MCIFVLQCPYTGCESFIFGKWSSVNQRHCKTIKEKSDKYNSGPYMNLKQTHSQRDKLKTNAN